jgi:SP family general alpha glucoside:H+ symporter-like MFS transporter
MADKACRYVNLCWVIGQFIGAGVLRGVNARTDEWAYKVRSPLRHTVQSQSDSQIPFAIQWIWPVPLFILTTLAPESPWFLVRAGRLDEAERSVARLAKKGEKTDPPQIVAMMVRTNKVEQENRSGTSYLVRCSQLCNENR